MLAFFRRHRGAFLITLTIIIILSFTVWGSSWRNNDVGYARKAQPTDHALTLFGKDYTLGDVMRAQRSLEFSMRYMQSYELLSSLMMLGGGGGFGGGDQVVTLLLARHLMEDMGIRASDAEAQSELEKLPALQTNGKFDLSRGQMLEEMAGSMGFGRDELLSIMRDTIGLRKLQDVVSKNYIASSVAAEKQYASGHHTVKGSKITFETETFKKAASVTDDEIKKYYDENKETYKTEEKRAVSYIFIENPKELDKKPLEERQKEQNKVVERVNAFNEQTRTKKLKFADAAKATKEKVETVPAFAKDEPPAALKSESKLIDLIFARLIDDKAAPEAVEGSNGWYVFDVTKIEEPKQQTLAEVKDKIKDVLASQKADEARSKAVNDARAALADGLKAGKKIEDLAKEKKLTLEALPEINIANPPQELPNGAAIAQEAAQTAIGSLSKAVDYDKGTLLIYVAAKELRKSPDSANLRKSEVDGLSQRERMQLFRTWFAKKRTEAKVENKLGASA